ncbi:hypothetical protein [Pseudonocardia sp. NPDC049154]|uniref:hypothetical protein n=1 Tax=Pseudonocardia sp. NPDC049154 TaxID=3155501 RepID=UPI0033C22412
MLVHLALITWGYAGGRVTAVPGTFWTLTVDYPGMLLALAGTVCLILVVVTSVRAARSRLRHESWHLLHLYTVKDLGDGSRLVRSLRPGTRVLVEGPYGRLTARPRTRDRVALIGAGVGITPLRALAEGLPYAPGDAVLLHRGAPLFTAEFDVLARERGLQVHRLPGPRRAADSWLGDGAGPGDDRAVLLGLVPDVAQRDVYLCGPDAWSASVRRTLAAAGVPASRIHVEKFGW